MVVVGTLSTILDINLEGVGATYTGKGFRIVSGFSQTITRCRAVNMGGEPLYFDSNAGGGANVTVFEGYPVDTDAYAGCAIAGDTAPHPRFFRGMWLSGANFALGPGAGNGGSMTEFYIRDLRFDATSTLFHISNGRCATLGATTTLKGFDHSIDGVAFAGPVALDSAQGINLGPSCSVPSLTENATNSQYNSVYVQRRTYTPTWTQTSATPAIGNGTLTGNYVRAGHMCHVQIELVAGSTTTSGMQRQVIGSPFRSLATFLSTREGFLCGSMIRALVRISLGGHPLAQVRTTLLSPWERSRSAPRRP